MSDNDDDYMCEEEEDYGLVRFIINLQPNTRNPPVDLFNRNLAASKWFCRQSYRLYLNSIFQVTQRYLYCRNIFQEYSEDSNSEPDVDLENQYYNSKALKEDEPKAALISFQKVLELEGGDKGEWGFKALKQMIKINFKLVSKNQNIKFSSYYYLSDVLNNKKFLMFTE